MARSRESAPPRIMAWWLDPANQPRPAEFGGPLEEKNQPTQQQQQKTPDPFALPVGIESIAPLRANNSLLVIGTREAVQELGKTVAFLDQPIRQIEIETHVVPLTPEEMKFLGLDFAQPPASATNPADQRTQPSFSYTNNLLDVLATHPKTGPMAEAKIPRVLALNNLTSLVPASRSHPVPAELQEKLALLFPQEPNIPPLELQTPLQIKLTPTINNDDTVTMLLDLSSQVQLGRQGDTTALALGKPAAITCIANIKDGQTIALGGFFNRNFTSAFVGRALPTQIPVLGDIPLTGKLFRSSPSTSTQLVVFLTPRIVRR